MPTTTRFRANVKVGRNGQEGAVVLRQTGSFDPTVTTAATTGVVIPEGAYIMDVISDGGGTGGASPTVDIGDGTDADFFANELDADGASSALAAGTGGTGLLTTLAEDKTVYGVAGASAAAGGTVNVTVVYSINEASAKEPSSE